MYGDYFAGRLRQRYGLKMIVAEGQHPDAVHEALCTELARGVFLAGTPREVRRGDDRPGRPWSRDDHPWLTEFGMLVKAEDSPVPLIDTTVAHAEATVEIASATPSRWRRDDDSVRERTPVPEAFLASAGSWRAAIQCFRREIERSMGGGSSDYVRLSHGAAGCRQARSVDDHHQDQRHQSSTRVR
jgi:hypothetical protein